MSKKLEKRVAVLEQLVYDLTHKKSRALSYKERVKTDKVTIIAIIEAMQKKSKLHEICNQRSILFILTNMRIDNPKIKSDSVIKKLLGLLVENKDIVYKRITIANTVHKCYYLPGDTSQKELLEDADDDNA